MDTSKYGYLLSYALYTFESWMWWAKPGRNGHLWFTLQPEVIWINNIILHSDFFCSKKKSYIKSRNRKRFSILLRKLAKLTMLQ